MTHALVSLVVAGVAFCGSHTLLSSTRLRGSLRDQLGEQGFLFVYSLTALVIFAWFVVAYARAPIVVLWPAAAVDGVCPGTDHAVGDAAAGRRLYDRQSDRGRHGAIGTSRRSGSRHPAGDPASGNVGGRVVGDRAI